MATGVLLALIIISNYAFAIIPYNDDGNNPKQEHRVRRASNEDMQKWRDMSPANRPGCGPGEEAPDTRVDTTQRLADLRAKFSEASIVGYLIPSEDAHQSEYPSDYDERRKYISGMSGTAGRAVVLGNKAALWTDGRYFLQAEQQLDCNWILMREGENGVPSIEEWVSANVNSGDKLGASPFLLSVISWQDLSAALQGSNIKLVELQSELIDQIWTTDRPAQPNTPVYPLPIQFSGKSWQDKVKDMYTAMESENVDIMIVTGLDETAWLLNLRASDISYNPFVLSYILVNRIMKRTTLYLKDFERKLNADPIDPSTVDVKTHLNTDSTGSCAGAVDMCVEVKEYDEMALLTQIRTDVGRRSGKVWMSYFCNYAIYIHVKITVVRETERLLVKNTPAAIQKAQKNAVEREGMKRSHIRDAVALISFMAKLEKEVQDGKEWSEIRAAAELKKYRFKQKDNRGLSFNSISAVGSNGAVIHYTASNVTNKIITTSEMYLLDSGGQYLDGTTDVTRTFHFGTPTDFEKECYTRVLMGQIDLAKYIFAKGPLGREIDAIAREPLWKVGLQYRHGTGHGIGMFLSVHEGPGRISLAHARFVHDEPLNEFQFFSDEPGYYEDGKFGVRLENIVMIRKATTKYQFPGTTFLGFETVTLVPYEPHIIDQSLLDEEQIDWLNNYNEQINSTIGPLLEGDDLASRWLFHRTRRIEKQNMSPMDTSGVTSVVYSFCLLISTSLICLLFK